ncbi:MAG: DUF6152 family protein [Vicinamibacterales bacterium]
MRKIVSLLLLVATSLVARPHAHHGAAAYDLQQTRTLQATVTGFRWANPHGLIEFDVHDATGRTEHWTAETAGLTIMLRAGWTKSTLAPGMRLTIAGHPARNGSHTMILEHVTFSDGRVLNNFVPRDLAGVWFRSEAAASFSPTPPPMTAWAEARFREHKPTVGPAAALDANDPTVACFPAGFPYVLVVPVPFEIIQLPDRIVQLFEYNHNVRRIYTDGREHPSDLHDTESAPWMGHSVGRWEGDTLVAETVGFNDRSWLDRLGRPHSEQLRVVERLRRANSDTLHYLITIDDPVAYASAWSGEMTFHLRRDWEILEHHCMPADGEYAAFKARAWAR